ncbi:MAG: aspartate-semialdehyde dehydrogenase [Planctomycetota bacterium]|jgi:aspartate-semialdehyde dehydrogenase
MADREYNVGVVGAGRVGECLVEVLEQRRFPVAELRIMARSSRKQEMAGREREIIAASEGGFEGLDIALFAGTEGASGASRLYGWRAVEQGALVVDNGNDFRMDERVPLVVPEVNAEAMRRHQGFIANPNCSTIQMVMALAPLDRAAGLKRVVVSTYQSVSGTGRPGVRALSAQRRAAAEGGNADPDPYPHVIYDNVVPQIGSLKDEFPGYYSEEIKMIQETRKILDRPNLAITATCVRVPVEVAHSEAINAEFERELSVEEARELLSSFDGVVVVDEPGESRYPLAADAAGKDAVYVGRIRKDPSNRNALDLWCVSDNLRKGAALNAVQIAERAIEMGLL